MCESIRLHLTFNITACPRVIAFFTRLPLYHVAYRAENKLESHHLISAASSARPSLRYRLKRCFIPTDRCKSHHKLCIVPATLTPAAGLALSGGPGAVAVHGGSSPGVVPFADSQPLQYLHKAVTSALPLLKIGVFFNISLLKDRRCEQGRWHTLRAVAHRRTSDLVVVTAGKVTPRIHFQAATRHACQ